MLSSQRVVPRRLLGSGFTFAHPTVERDPGRAALTGRARTAVRSAWRRTADGPTHAHAHAGTGTGTGTDGSATGKTGTRLCAGPSAHRRSPLNARAPVPG